MKSQSATNSRPSSKASEKSEAKASNHQGTFARAACLFAHLAGKPATFLTATAAVVIWAISGPLFGFSDTWQLVINTSTTIVTFLMVFLIQNTQNRDTTAIQVKLSELILRMDGADDKLANAEDLSDEELEQLHRHYQHRAKHARESLERRRGDNQKAA